MIVVPAKLLMFLLKMELMISYYYDCDLTEAIVIMIMLDIALEKEL